LRTFIALHSLPKPKRIIQAQLSRIASCHSKPAVAHIALQLAQAKARGVQLEGELARAQAASAASQEKEREAEVGDGAVVCA
jgi:hypothetical protein